MEVLNIALRVIMLQLLTATSEMSFRRRYFAVGFFLFTVWVTFFRLTFVRASTFYIGAFRNENSDFVQNFYGFLVSAPVATITDTLILLGAITLFIHLVKGNFLKKAVS